MQHVRVFNFAFHFITIVVGVSRCERERSKLECKTFCSFLLLALDKTADYDVDGNDMVKGSSFEMLFLLFIDRPECQGTFKEAT